MMKFSVSVKITGTTRCIFCGKEFSGEESQITHRCMMHLVFRHPIQTIKEIQRRSKNIEGRDNNEQK